MRLAAEEAEAALAAEQAALHQEEEPFDDGPEPKTDSSWEPPKSTSEIQQGERMEGDMTSPETTPPFDHDDADNFVANAVSAEEQG